MKPSQLPPTDVANFAALSREEKLKALVRFHNPPLPPVSYTAYRRNLSDLLGLDAGALALDRVDLDKVEREIVRECKIKTDLNVEANLMVARASYALAKRLNIGGRRASELSPRTMGGHHVEPWNRFLLNIDERPVVPFFDPRRSSSRLTRLGHQVAFSLMHSNIREVYPDHADTRFAIIQFGDVISGVREACITFDDDVALIPHAELVEMVSELFELHAMVSAGREEEARRYADDDVSDEERTEMERLWREGA